MGRPNREWADSQEMVCHVAQKLRNTAFQRCGRCSEPFKLHWWQRAALLVEHKPPPWQRSMRLAVALYFFCVRHVERLDA
jgi:hypothetical protein